MPPKPCRQLWRGIKDLAADKGDVKQLDGKLAHYWRLRVGRMRVVFEQKTKGGERVIVCFYADHRATVYSIVEQLLASGLLEELKG